MEHNDIEAVFITIMLSIVFTCMAGYLAYRYIRQRIKNRKKW
jgi:hypothetical protein